MQDPRPVEFSHFYSTQAPAADFLLNIGFIEYLTLSPDCQLKHPWKLIGVAYHWWIPQNNKTRRRSAAAACNMAISPELLSNLTAASRGDQIVTCIAGVLPHIISYTHMLMVTVACLTWLVYDMILTADAEVRPAYIGPADTELTAANVVLPTTKVCPILVLIFGRLYFS
jgi:hypothetical protein